MICSLAWQPPVWQQVGATETSLTPASIQSFSSAWNQMVCTSKERHVGSCWGQGGISNTVIELFLVSTVLYQTWGKGSDSFCCFECYTQLMKWKTSDHQYSAGGTGSCGTLQGNACFQYSGFPGPRLVGRVVSHGCTQLMWADWSKLPSACWGEIDVKSVTGVYKLLFLLVGNTSDQRDTKFFCPSPTYCGHFTLLRHFLGVEFSV